MKKYYFRIREFENPQKVIQAIRKVNPTAIWRSHHCLETYVYYLSGPNALAILTDNMVSVVSDKYDTSGYIKYNPIADKLGLI